MRLATEGTEVPSRQYYPPSCHNAAGIIGKTRTENCCWGIIADDLEEKDAVPKTAKLIVRMQNDLAGKLPTD